MITFNNKFLCRCRRDSETCKRLDVLPKAVMALKLILCFNNQFVRAESIEEVTQFENGPDKWLLGKLCLCSSSIFHNQVAKPRLQFHLDDCHHLHFPKWFYHNFSIFVIIKLVTVKWRAFLMSLKRGCVFPMVIWPFCRMEKHRVNDHPYHAPQFTTDNTEWQRSSPPISFPSLTILLLSLGSLSIL